MISGITSTKTKVAVPQRDLPSQHLPSFGTTASSSTRPRRLQQAMARSVSSRDQSGDDPNASFAAPGASHFDPSSYNFPIDTQLTMESNYSLPQFARQLGDAASSVEHAAAAQLANTPAVSNGAASITTTDPAMAPPHTSSQVSFMPSTARKSVDDLSESMHTPQTGDKRKRSKTSRACDECRRKKVYCISRYSGAFAVY